MPITDEEIYKINYDLKNTLPSILIAFLDWV